MKALHHIIQSKGGVGKSLLISLLALSQIDNSSLFVDVDSSTQTSTRQLLFLGQNKLETISLLNEKGALIRDKFISYLESLKNSQFDDILFDFGAPESEQFPALVERDLPYKEFLDELDMKAHFHIVIAGGGAYSSSINYLKRMLEVLNGQFDITVWQNITSFNNSLLLAQELENNCINLGLPLRKFGDFDPSSDLGSQILEGIRKGYGINDYQTGARIRLKKELKDNFSNGK